MGNNSIITTGLFSDGKGSVFVKPENEGRAGKSEEVLIILRSMQSGSDDRFGELCEIYKPLVERTVMSTAARYAEYNVEADDLKQEATLALYNAAMKFDLKQTAVTFGLYAKICMRNRMISVGRKLMRPGGKLKRLSTLRPDYANTVGAGSMHPAQTEQSAVIPEETLGLLSRYERRVCELYISGCSYKDMASKLGRSEKSIDNAVYRIRAKIKGTVR